MTRRNIYRSNCAFNLGKWPPLIEPAARIGYVIPARKYLTETVRAAGQSMRYSPPVPLALSSSNSFGDPPVPVSAHYIERY